MTYSLPLIDPDDPQNFIHPDHMTPPPETENPAPSQKSGAVIMSNDEYHAHPSLGSTTIKRALTHPARMSAPSGIRRQTADEGTRLHCAVLEPEELHNRYTVAPRPEDYPHALKTSDDLKAALRAAGVKGYSAKKRDDLAAMVRESIPGAVLWSDILSEHGSGAARKTFVSQDEWDEMRRARDAALSHPVIKGEGIFTDGRGELSFFADVKKLGFNISNGNFLLLLRNFGAKFDVKILAQNPFFCSAQKLPLVQKDGMIGQILIFLIT